MPVSNWSTTAADNDDSDSTSGIAFAENQAPGSVNDSMRSLMAVIKGDFAKSHLTNGYQKFPNGLILQWGQSVGTGDYGVTLPTAFPTACMVVLATAAPGSIAADQFVVMHADTATTTSFTIRKRYYTSGTVGSANNLAYWAAIGW